MDSEGVLAFEVLGSTRLEYEFMTIHFSHSREVLNGVAIAFVLRAVGAGLAFALNVVIGRLLGAEGAGLYFLALSVVTIGAVIAKLGLGNALLRFIASGASCGDWDRVVGVFQMGMRLAAGASFVVASGVFALSAWLAEHVFGELALVPTLRIMSVGILTFAAMTLLAESLKGLKRIRNSMLISGVLYPGIALVMIYPLVSIFGPPGAAITYVLSTGAAALIGWIMWRRNVADVASPSPWFDRVVLWRSCRPLWTMSIINQGILPWAPLFLLGIWGTAEEVGRFGAATRVAMLVTFFLTTINIVIAPKFAELYEIGEIETLGRLARRFSLLTTLAASPIFVLLIIGSDQLMELFGPDFTETGAVLAILAIGQAVNTLTGSVGYLLMMTGHERDFRNASIFAVLVMVVAALLLIPEYGILGAATSSAISVASLNIYSTIIARKRLRILLLPIGRF